MDVLWVDYRCKTHNFGCIMDVFWMHYGCIMDVLWVVSTSNTAGVSTSNTAGVLRTPYGRHLP
jgi:hypothetical protein